MLPECCIIVDIANMFPITMATERTSVDSDTKRASVDSDILPIIAKLLLLTISIPTGDYC